jgi:transcriptional regulator with XRE-family HTH domain
MERGGLKAVMQLRDRLAELRRERGLTLRALRERVLERTGAVLSISYLSELERTDALPSLETLARLARAYDISPQDLLAPVELPAGDMTLGRATGTGDTLAQYPPGLRALIEREIVTPEWAGTLARIEFRGQRPRTEDEWQAIYGLLKAFLDPATVGGARVAPVVDLTDDTDDTGDARDRDG